MGAPVPKQFLEINGKTILQLSIERFLEAIPDLGVVCVLPPQWREKWKKECMLKALDCPQILVDGGITRFHSVKNALERIPDNSIVMVHDSVRPLISVQKLREMDKTMRAGCRALIPVLPVTDTLHMLDGSAEDGTLRLSDSPAPERRGLYGAQTPQCFRSEDLKAAYSAAYSTAFTDDASVASAAGIPLSFTLGEKTNLKITTPEDLALAKLLV